MDQERRDKHIGFVKQNHGLRIPLMDVFGVDNGWVVNAKINPDLWRLFRTDVIPLMLMPQESRFKLPNLTGRARERDLHRLNQLYGEGIKCFVWGEDGWLLTYIRPNKLKTDEPKKLLDEAMDARKARNHELALILETEYQVATGCLDLR